VVQVSGPDSSDAAMMNPGEFGVPAGGAEHAEGNCF